MCAPKRREREIEVERERESKGELEEEGSFLFAAELQNRHRRDEGERESVVEERERTELLCRAAVTEFPATAFVACGHPNRCLVCLEFRRCHCSFQPLPVFF
ncbi:hypothetical protein PIB30_095628, partial [Stylosanthes scabra]|nr:hypothetical protein [Stylosanthes scabra]